MNGFVVSDIVINVCCIEFSDVSRFRLSLFVFEFFIENKRCLESMKEIDLFIDDFLIDVFCELFFEEDLYVEFKEMLVSVVM